MEIDYDKWRTLWSESRMFRFDSKDERKPLFVIDTPPPFTSGDLHMGQLYWVIYVDSLARYFRMKGHNVLYPLGWDMQGFPTEIQTEKKYGKLPREEFYERCAETANANMNMMKEQMLKLGATFDDTLEYTTMSSEYRSKVQLSLIQMHEKGFIYRGKHPVEWCSNCDTSIAREETEETERESVLNHIEFSVGKEKIEIATTRPELMHACVAIAVNRRDERYRELIGKTATVPIFGSKVPVIEDDIVDMEFGTGMEMVCTFGDKNDVMMFYKHKLNLVEGISGQGRLINSGKYDGLTCKDARKAILTDLRDMGLLGRQDSTKQTVKVHDRCGTPIELIASTQWFIRSKEHSDKIKEIARQVKFVPEHKRQDVYNWIDFIEWDWSISRNRVFGTPLPFWYCVDCGHIMPAKKESLPVNPTIDASQFTKCEKCGSEKVIGERDTCDVWVDSSITPLAIAGWPDNTKLFKRAFPATLRIQGSDILRTWAFYTMLRTWALTGNKPFDSMIVHGMILGSDGREMHKSLGNGIMPQDVLKKYDIDSIRLWVAMSGSAGKDKPFSEVELNHASGFGIKLYNSALFVKEAVAEVKKHTGTPEKHMGIFDIWILSRLNRVVKEVEESYGRYDLYGAMNTLTNFYWHEFCDYYIENVKYRVKDEKHNIQSRYAAAFTLEHVLAQCLRMIAPVMPFLAEHVNEMFSSESVFEGKMPEYRETEKQGSYVINGVIQESELEVDYEAVGNLLNDVIRDVRKLKSSGRMALNKQITAINIKVPETYLNVLERSERELMAICKAGSVNASAGPDYKVTIEP